MKIKSQSLFWLILAGLLVAALRMVIAQDAAGQVVRHPDTSQPLAERWEWALREAVRQDRDIWIGYSIERMMSPGSSVMIGSNISYMNGRVRRDGPSLESLLTGRPDVDVEDDDDAVRREAGRWIEDREDGTLVPREVALLFRYPRGATSAGFFETVMAGNTELCFDLKGAPLLWLGPVENEASLTWVTQRYREHRSDEQKERLIALLGMHDLPARVVPLLQEILVSSERDELREAAAHWMGWQHVPAAVRLLDETARHDRSGEVRQAAVFGLSQADLPEATQALILLARNAEDSEVREDAIFWLGQEGGPEATALLDELALHDTDPGIQEKAIFAISQLPDEEAIPRLLKLAREHSDREARKEAIFWLGQAAGERAAEALGDIALNDEATDVQKQAVFAISQLDDAVPMLIEISKTHPNPQVRKEAIFWMGQSEDPRALEALEALVRQ